MNTSGFGVALHGGTVAEQDRDNFTRLVVGQVVLRIKILNADYFVRIGHQLHLSLDLGDQSLLVDGFTHCLPTSLFLGRSHSRVLIKQRWLSQVDSWRSEFR